MHDDLTRARDQFKGMSIREIMLWNAWETKQLKDHVAKQNGSVGKLKIGFFALLLGIVALHGEKALSFIARAIF